MRNNMDSVVPSPKPASTTWLRDLLRPLTGTLRDVAAMSLFINLVALAVPIFVLQVYDRVVFQAGLTTLQGLVAGVLLALGFDFLLRLARARLLQKAALRIEALLGRKLFARLFALPLRALEHQGTGRGLQLFRDIDTLRNTFSGATAVLAIDLPFAALFLALVVIVAAPIAWVLLVAAPLFVIVAWLSAVVLNRRSDQERRAAAARDGLLAEILAGRATIKALNLAPALQPRWEAHHADAIDTALHRGADTDLFATIGTSLTLLTTVSLTTVGALAIIDQKITIGALVATNMLSVRLIAPFAQLIANWRAYAACRQAIGRLSQVFAAATDDGGDSLAPERPNGALRLEKLQYSFAPDSDAVVQDVSLALEARGFYGLAGPNGSGKTTLMKLILGLYRPDHGRVLIDGADIAQFSRAVLARWIGYVPQEVVLISGSIAENIALADPQADEHAILAAARRAGLHAAVAAMPDGYATQIGEGGHRLSGGLRQRIAIARALLGDPPLILLDEPTAHLDGRAAEAVRASLIALARDHVVLVASHDPTLLAACGSLVVLEAGRIAMAGPAREVLPHLLPRPRPVAPARPAGDASRGGAA